MREFIDDAAGEDEQTVNLAAVLAGGEGMFHAYLNSMAESKG